MFKTRLNLPLIFKLLGFEKGNFVNIMFILNLYHNSSKELTIIVSKYTYSS